MQRKVGILTGGGDAPGLNGIIESCVRSLSQNNISAIGICDGFEGIFNEKNIELNLEFVEGAHAKAGTILGTSNKSKTEGREKEFLEKFNRLGVEGLIVCGGDGTFAGISRVSNEIKIVGVPKTIDNDLAGTDITFGYDTACAVVSESSDALRFTADAHRRIIVVETMGRTAGWIALGGGLSSYADAILIPERPFDRQSLLNHVRLRQHQGKRGLIIVAAEGAMARGEEPIIAFRVSGSPQAERYGGIAQTLGRWLEGETGWESRHVVLGHLQRSRTPTTTDRFLTVTMGVQAAQLVTQQKWGNAVVCRNGEVQPAPLQEVMQPARLVDPHHRWVQTAQSLGIFI